VLSLAAGPHRPSQPAPLLRVEDFVPLSEGGLERLDAAAHVSDVDPSLLHATPARDLTERLFELTAALRALDVGAVLQRQGWWSRLTGRDLEARLRLELACRNLASIAAGASMAAAEARAAGSKLWRTRQDVVADLSRLDGVLAVLSAGMPMVADADPKLRARFERRVANLAVLQSSNRLTLAQLELAIDNLKALLDRFGEVERLLVPLWRHGALAASQGVSTAASAISAYRDLKSVHGGLVSEAELITQGMAK
jgi:hypothetical protein